MHIPDDSSVSQPLGAETKCNYFHCLLILENAITFTVYLYWKVPGTPPIIAIITVMCMKVDCQSILHQTILYGIFSPFPIV